MVGTGLNIAAALESLCLVFLRKHNLIVLFTALFLLESWSRFCYRTALVNFGISVNKGGKKYENKNGEVKLNSKTSSEDFCTFHPSSTLDLSLPASDQHHSRPIQSGTCPRVWTVLIVWYPWRPRDESTKWLDRPKVPL